MGRSGRGRRSWLAGRLARCPRRGFGRVLPLWTALLIGAASHASPATLDRPADPVVLTGEDLSPWGSVATGDVVAFRFDGGWVQIPVQVDERAVIGFDDVYNHVGSYGGGITALGYTDAGTFTGPDPDPGLDGDDEIVFMARDAGDRPPAFSEPAGVVAGSGVEVEVSDPVADGVGYAYLFLQDGSLDPAAGQQYVAYDFDLLSGDYLSTYSIAAGPNPEDSTVATLYYARHFSDRWIDDELGISGGLATGVDILDRHKNLFAPGVCGRSEDTFTAGEGAFVVNKSGPVRALRSYVGANSGPLTQRRHVYYERREDILTFLRVHAIGGMMDFIDYSPDAAGMTYRNDLNPGGALIDGVPDTLAPGLPAWEMVTGAPGSLTTSFRLDTNIPLTDLKLFYEDDTTPATTQCTGDAFAYGSSGGWIDAEIPDTDPRHGTAAYLTAVRTQYFDAPGLTASDAAQRWAWAVHPVVTTARPWNPCLDGDGDGYGDPASPLCPHPGWDCDDLNPSVHTGAVEGPGGDPTCGDGLDNDCDGAADLEDPGCAPCPDGDGDGYGSPASGDCPHPEADCDDGDAAVNPGTEEVCDNGRDDDCDGLSDAQDPDCCIDEDGDGYGSPASAACAFLELDCDDSDPDVHPNNPEDCSNGIDDDCDGKTDLDDKECQQSGWAAAGEADASSRMPGTDNPSGAFNRLILILIPSIAVLLLWTRRRPRP